MNDQEVVDAYIEWCAEKKRLRPYTIEQYRATLGHLLDWLDRPLAEVDADTVERFAFRPRPRCTKPKATTSAKDVTIIRTFIGWAQRRGALPPSDAQDAVAPKLTHRIPKPIDDQLWRKVWLSDLAPDDRLWLGLGYFAGLRRYEIVTMSPAEVEPHNGVLRLADRKGGSQAAVEYVDMCRIVAAELPWVTEGWEAWADLLAQRAAQRAGERWLWLDSEGIVLEDVSTLNRRLVAIQKRVGIPERGFTPHHLRHSCATNLLRSNVPVTVIADLLSHASVTTTMRYMQSSGQLGRMLNSRSA